MKNGSLLAKASGLVVGKEESEPASHNITGHTFPILASSVAWLGSSKTTAEIAASELALGGSVAP